MAVVGHAQAVSGNVEFDSGRTAPPTGGHGGLRKRLVHPVRVSMLVALGPALCSAAGGATQQAKKEEPPVPQFEAGLKFGVSLVGACDECSSRELGTSLAVDAIKPLGSGFGIGMAIDYVSVAYTRSATGGERDHILTTALLLRPVPLRSGRTIGYLDLALGLSNRALGAFAGLGVEYAFTKHVRIGPYARVVWAGARSTTSCYANGTGCSTDPGFGHAYAFGLGITGMAL